MVHWLLLRLCIQDVRYPITMVNGKQIASSKLPWQLAGRKFAPSKSQGMRKLVVANFASQRCCSVSLFRPLTLSGTSPILSRLDLELE